MRPRPLLALLAVLVLASPAFAAESLKDLVTALDAKDAKERSRAYRALAAKKDPDALPMIRRAMAEFSDVGRYLGVAVIDGYPGKQQRTTWRKLAKSEVPYLQFCAGLWLARRGEDKALDEAVESLVAPGVPANVRLWMVRRVTPYDPPEVRAGLRALLRPEEAPTVLRQLVSFLNANQDHEAAPQARALLRDKRVGVRAMAGALLYALGHTAHAKDLATALKQGVPYYDLGIVVQVLTANRRVADEILDAVTARLGTEKSAYSLLRLIGLIRRFRHASARPALKRLVDHANGKVARAAFDALVEMSGPVREDTLQPLLRGEDVEKKLWAAEALRKQDDISGIGAVVFALQKGTVLQRKTAAEMLGSYVMDLSVPPLLDALEDEHPQVRRAARVSLATVLKCLFPYRHLDLRTASIEVIRDWWNAQREADW